MFVYLGTCSTGTYVHSYSDTVLFVFVFLRVRTGPYVHSGWAFKYSVPNNIRVAQLKDGPNSQGLYRVFSNA